VRILIVEDEKRLCRTIADLLEAHNYTVDLSYDGESGLDNALSGIYDAMILDVMLPKLDGLTVAHRIRKAGVALPILMLTARSALEDKVSGLDSGADYYLTKPFASEELLACLRALTRKQGSDSLEQVLSAGDLRLELSRCLLCCGERSVRLSRKEFELMQLFLSNVGQVVSKETMLLKVWGYESDAEDNNVEVYVSFLRKKLAHLKSTATIRNLRMLGYQLETGGGDA
jgi:DNA-binding response OmpR family regulator